MTSSLKLTVTTAEASLGTGDYALYRQRIEGYRTSKLAFGTASAQTVTLSFWSKIHRTGNYSGSLINSAANRSYPFSFTQNVADTWEFKTVTIAGDTAGTWIGNTNGIGLSIVICIAAGTSVAGSAGSWQAANFLGVTGTTNGVAATTDIFQITGVTLYPGTVAPSSTSSIYANLKRPYPQELNFCQRYLYVDSIANWFSIEGTSCGSGINQIVLTGQFPQPMRVNPSTTYPSWSTSGVNAPTAGFLTATGLGLTAVSNVAAGTRMWVYYNGGSIKADARL
jgi:hypothetical protein